MSDDGTPSAFVPPDTAPAADLPKHARERLVEMRKAHFFTSDLSVNEFLLVKQAGFEPLGLVMGSSIYQIQPSLPYGAPSSGQEMTGLSKALQHARQLAMQRMEEEAEALGADGIVGVRLKVDLHAWGSQIAEFMAVGTAVRHATGEKFTNAHGKPFSSDLTGQDFWTLLRSGYRPVGFVMGNCVYYVPPDALDTTQGDSRNMEVVEYTHAFYDARELAIERLQDEAESLHATGIVGVTVQEEEHSWGPVIRANQTKFNGEIIEFFVIGTAVVPMANALPVPKPRLVMPGNR
jgi:uncharacterized protein YbjQ (UPF0145 family)